MQRPSRRIFSFIILAVHRRRVRSPPLGPACRTVRNLDPWYGAFDVSAGQRLFLAPEDGVRVW